MRDALRRLDVEQARQKGYDHDQHPAASDEFEDSHGLLLWGVTALFVTRYAVS